MAADNTTQLIRDLRRCTQAQALRLTRIAADRLEDLEERVAIMSGGRELLDGEEVAKGIFLLSACVGGMTGPKVLDEVEKIIGKARRI